MTPLVVNLMLCLLQTPPAGAQTAQPSAPPALKPARFEVVFDPKVSAQPFTGRVYVTLHRRLVGKPPNGPSWFNPDPFFARDVRDWKPGTPLVLDDACLSF